MSQFHDYDVSAEHYDATRRAVGLELLHALVAAHYQTLQRPLQVLDVGCGTCTYAHALLVRHKERIGKFVGIDGSVEMLKVARAKLDSAHSGAKIVLLQADLQETLPFPDERFDVVICTQVVHHLADSKPWYAVSRLMGECRRALINGGRLYLNWSTSDQQLHYWHCHYFPKSAREALRKRFPTREWMAATLKWLGFIDAYYHIECESVVDERLYECPERAKDKAWRDGSSSAWALLDAEQLQKALAAIEADLKSGSIGEVLKKCREAARSEGLSLTVAASRGGAVSQD